jgi:CheY-like chemotaxis protein/anti-sigma regulatory factor (Ser/Thr protein kinase)
VLSNLLSNALKFTPHGAVELGVAIVGETASAQLIEFTVSDTGIGISDTDQQRLFHPFSQVSTDNARGSEGSGLGLAICRQLVEAMGGAVVLRSELGAGTIVRVRLELARGLLADAEPIGGHVGAQGGQRRRLPSRRQALRERSLLLLVEDNAVNRQVLGGQLDAIGFRVDAVEDADSALARVASGDYALVFTDIQLPRIDGYELASRLRAAERVAGRPRVPILALTASALQGERERCRAAGMDDLVTKPTTMPILAGTLRRWLPHVEWPEPGERLRLAPPPAALDVSALDEISAGDAELGARVMLSYADSVQAELVTLTDAIERGARDAVRRSAHQIVGSSRTIGARDVAAVAGRLERAAAHADDDELGELAHALRNALVAVMPAAVR